MMAEAEAKLFTAYEWAIVRMATCMPVSATPNPPLLVFASLEFVRARNNPFTRDPLSLS
jgi:hypothetical protein